MSESDQQKMCLMGSAILSCAISWEQKAQDYKLQRLIFPHIKANKLYEKQIGLIKQYYDDEWINFALVLGENGDLNNSRVIGDSSYGLSYINICSICLEIINFLPENLILEFLRLSLIRHGT